jgi:hypothetical protein
MKKIRNLVLYYLKTMSDFFFIYTPAQKKTKKIVVKHEYQIQKTIYNPWSTSQELRVNKFVS